jgi:hypothetical protein
MSYFGLWDTVRCLLNKFILSFLSTRHCAVSRRPKHDITVSHKQKYVKQCFPNQAINKKCPTHKFPYLITLQLTSACGMFKEDNLLHNDILFFILALLKDTTEQQTTIYTI